jgi:hypothetical protein
VSLLDCALSLSVAALLPEPLPVPVFEFEPELPASDAFDAVAVVLLPACDDAFAAT